MVVKESLSVIVAQITTCLIENHQKAGITFVRPAVKENEVRRKCGLGIIENNNCSGFKML